MITGSALECVPADASLIQLKTLVRLLRREAVREQSQAKVVEDFDPGHVSSLREHRPEVERHEVQVVECSQRVTVILDIAANGHRTSRIKNRPRRDRKAQ